MQYPINVPTLKYIINTNDSLAKIQYIPKMSSKCQSNKSIKINIIPEKDPQKKGERSQSVRKQASIEKRKQSHLTIPDSKQDLQALVKLNIKKYTTDQKIKNHKLTLSRIRIPDNPYQQQKKIKINFETYGRECLQNVFLLLSKFPRIAIKDQCLPAIVDQFFTIAQLQCNNSGLINKCLGTIFIILFYAHFRYSFGQQQLKSEHDLQLTKKQFLQMLKPGKYAPYSPSKDKNANQKRQKYILNPIREYNSICDYYKKFKNSDQWEIPKVKKASIRIYNSIFQKIMKTDYLLKFYLVQFFWELRLQIMMEKIDTYYQKDVRQTWSQVVEFFYQTKLRRQVLFFKW